MDVRDHTILITGAGAGIGRALAEHFRADGANVVGFDLESHAAAAKEVCDLAVAGDVRNPEQLADAVARTVRQFGGLTAVIANAGLGRRATIEDGDWADIQDVLEVNLLGVVHTVRAALPVMRQAGFGRIVSLVSRNAEFCPARLGAYNMSKAAVVAMTRTLAHEIRDVDVLANNLIPGPSRTEMNPKAEGDPGACYPTARMLVELPAGGPTGRTFYRSAEYEMYARFGEDTAAIVHDNELARAGDRKP